MTNTFLARRLSIGSILLCLVGCNDSATSQNAASYNTAEVAVSYEIKETEKEIADENSPLGYWEVRKRYPVFSSSQDVAIAEILNERISDLLERYSCSSLGEQTFSVENAFIDERVFSMQYKAMWMCATMPSPDSASGTLNISLADGQDIVMQDEFMSKSEYDAFIHNAILLMRKQLKRSEDEMGKGCPTINAVGGFYVRADSIVLESPRMFHGESSCEVEVSFDKDVIAEMLKPGSILR